MSVKRHVKVTKARKAAVSRRVASALAGFLKKMNPGTKAAGAKVQRLKGGVIKITPLKRNPPSRAQIQREYNKEMAKRRAMGLPKLTKADFYYRWYPEQFK